MLLLASGKQARREGEVFFLIPGYCRACGESGDRDEGQKVNERGFLQPRKEGREFPLASDCLTCKNVAFVAELYSHFFFFGSLSDQLSPSSSLCSLVASRVCLQPTLVGSCSAAEFDWFVRRGLNRPLNDNSS